MYEVTRKCYQKNNQEILKLQIMYYLTFPHSVRSVTKFAIIQQLPIAGFYCFSEENKTGF